MDDKETKLFGTEVLDTRSAGFASGLFMHLARIIKPHKPERSAALQKHAEMAFKAAGEQICPTHKLYYAVQKYLLTGDEAAHQIVRDLADQAGAYAATSTTCPPFNGTSSRSARAYASRRRSTPCWRRAVGGMRPKTRLRHNGRGVYHASTYG